MQKVSVITVCYNSANTIEETVKSVIEQDYNSIEYIIVDGKSSDQTLFILDRYKNKINTLISEKDNGLYDAINKGIKAASGDIIAILHADDVFANDTVITDVVQTFSKHHTDTVYGDLQYVDRNNLNIIKRNWQSGNYYEGIFLKGWMPPHPSFFARKTCYDKFGLFTMELKSAADYEMMLRLLHKHKCTTTYLPKVLVKMRIGGKSNASFKNRIKANREDKKAWLMNGLKPAMFTLIRKPLSKLKQFIPFL
jgi:glycosyltransferase involved in cell wall biosynthesis